MRIAFLILSLDGGGAERTATSLSVSMAGKGHDVTILALTGKECFYPVSEKVNVRFLDLPALPVSPKSKRLRATWKRALTLRKTIKELHPDVLVGMSHIMSAYAVFCTIGTGICSIGTERANPYVLQAGIGMIALRKISSIFCNGFVTQTEKARSFFPRSVQKKANVIPNAVFNPLVSNVQIPLVREKCITALGRLDYNKGFDTLIQAFAQIANRFPDYNLVIYGEGKNRADFTELAQKCGLEKRVHMPGSSPDAILNVANSAAFVLSSRSEGMPNALIEAMACGVPCISTDCDMGPGELITNYENGILVPTNNISAMADAMEKVLTDTDLSQKISRNAFKIRTTNSIESITDKWLLYFKKITN